MGSFSVAYDGSGRVGGASLHFLHWRKRDHWPFCQTRKQQDVGTGSGGKPLKAWQTLSAVASFRTATKPTV